MIRILHVIAGLNTGGSELFLEGLVKASGSGELQHHVVSLSRLGSVGARMQRQGVPVSALGCTKGSGVLSGLSKLWHVLRDYGPDLVQGWMYHGNLAAAMTLWLGRVRCPLLWNVRHSLDQWADERLLLRGEIRFSGLIAGRPERIVFNSDRSASQHEQLGYPRSKALVIPNGFDLERFAPNTADRLSMRAQLGVDPDEAVLGMAARYHPLKDHANFLLAARIVTDQVSGARFVFVGRGVSANNCALMSLIREQRLESRTILRDECDDIASLLNAFDIYVSSSSSEAFPNAVGEAMSCGVPCVVTDAGESAQLVADTGIVVPPKSPKELAEGMLELIRAGADRRRVLGAAARERIRLNYSMERIARQYGDLYQSVCKAARD